jgi:UDP-N-acetylglucosamine acyltransferase
LPPYVMSQGYPAQPKGLNAEGLRRRGFSADAINALKQAYKLLYRDGLTFEQAKSQILSLQQQLSGDAQAAMDVFTRFLADVTRGVIR